MKLGRRVFIVRKSGKDEYGWLITLDLDRLNLSEEQLAAYAARAIVTAEQARLRELPESELDKIGKRIKVEKRTKLNIDAYMKV